MKIEIRSEEVINWFNDRDIPLSKTKLYLSEPFKSRGLEEYGGIFIPRFYEGHVFFTNDIAEIIRRYIHEASHGSFFENFPVGKQIAELDKRVYEKEKELFGEKNIERCYVITTPDLRIKSKIINLEEAVKLSKVQFEAGKDIFEVDKFEFDEYLKLSKQLNQLCSQSIAYLEGFALIVTEEITRCKFSVSQLSGPYKNGYNLLKQIKEKNGLNYLIRKLYELRLNI